MKMLQIQKYKMVILLIYVIFVSNFVYSASPLPVHNVEGNSGVFITSTAYMANPPEANNVFGLPSISASFTAIGEKDFESIAVTENIWGKIELGYAIERIGLGDWPADVQTAAGIHVDNHVFLQNLNTRYMIINEGGLDKSWMPAVTLGAHFKWNDGLNKINRQAACVTLLEPTMIPELSSLP